LGCGSPKASFVEYFLGRRRIAEICVSYPDVLSALLPKVVGDLASENSDEPRSCGRPPFKLIGRLKRREISLLHQVFGNVSILDT
jgi:hypothetical protein